MSDKPIHDILCQVPDRDCFAVRFEESPGQFVDLFPGLTGSYLWASRIAAGSWNRNGVSISPSQLRVYKVAPQSSTSMPAGGQKAKRVGHLTDALLDLGC